MADVAPPASSPAVDVASDIKRRESVTITEETTEGGITSVPFATAAEKPAKGKGLRALRDRIALRRSFITKHASLSSPTLLSSASEEPASDAQEVTALAASPKRAKTPTSIERLLTGKLGAKKGGKKAKDADTAPIPVALNAASSSTSSETSHPAGEQPLPVIPEADVVTSKPEPEVRATANADPEPLPLATKIHNLLSSVPPFLSFEPAPSPSDGQSQQPKGGDSDASPDAPTSVIPDSRLLSLLSSPSIMNGSLSRGRQSVWAMLDNLRLKALKTSADAGNVPLENVADRAEAVLEDDDSVMFYGPLVPDAKSSVELARSEIVSVDENGTVVEVLLDDAPLPHLPASDHGSSAAGEAKTEAFGWHWPFHRRAPPTPTKPKTVEKRMWVPSTEKLSLQVMWWGYRLWLPPPVLALLNDKEIEAAKLGAMLTNALQWLLNNVPESALPPALRPALQLVKSLVPYLGYIGGFVAWSWSAIKGFDQGNGVTLTATWLLPIALVPGTWEQKDVPAPTAPPGDPSSPTTGDPSCPSTGDPSGPGGDPSTSDPTTSPADPSAPTTPPPSTPTTQPMLPGSPGIMSV